MYWVHVLGLAELCFRPCKIIRTHPAGPQLARVCLGRLCRFSLCDRSTVYLSSLMFRLARDQKLPSYPFQPTIAFSTDLKSELIEQPLKSWKIFPAFHQTPKLWLEDLELVFCLLREEKEMNFTARKVHRWAAAMKNKTRGIPGSCNGAL